MSIPTIERRDGTQMWLFVRELPKLRRLQRTPVRFYWLLAHPASGYYCGEES